MSGEQAEVKKKNLLFWPLNLLPGLTHIGMTVFQQQKIRKTATQ